MPTSASLVTNLPADFNTFGQAVDTSMAQLKGGTTGQILSKTSATDMAFTWTTANPGDITGVTAGTGISGGGTSGDVTVTNSMATAMTTKGDLVPATGSGAFSRLGVGTNNQVLTADSTAATGLKWATPASSSKIGQVITATYSTQYSNATTTYGDTGLTATITPTAASSKIFVIITQPYATIKNSITAVGGFWEVLRDATSLGITAAEQSIYMTGASGNLQISILGWSVSYMDSPSSTSALVYKTQIKADAASTTVYTSTGSRKATITLMEILA